MDNYCIHKKRDEWLRAHPGVKFHCAPTPASWLNMVDARFGIIMRKALRGTNFSNIEELVKSIKDFFDVYNENAEFIIWRKREAKGSRLKILKKNFCN